MKKIGKHCKAYSIEKLREFSGWKEKANESGKPDAHSSESPALISGCLFLQEDLTVTRGIFLDEDIVFDMVTNEWQEFCQSELGFAGVIH